MFLGKDFRYAIPWNLFLISLGSTIYTFGIKTLAVPHQFMPGGIFGISSLIYYATEFLNPGMLFFFLNVPIFVFGWFKISRRFCLYSFYAMVYTTLIYQIIPTSFSIANQVYACVACGAMVGFGAGIVLRSLGSGGGTDIIAVYLYQKYNIGIGRFSFVFNFVLFGFSLAVLSPDLVVASMILVFISSMTVEKTLALFSQRKVVFIISNRPEEIGRKIVDELRRGATFLKGVGAYTGQDKKILMTVVNNIQLKRLEELVFTVDPEAMFIVENTFSVLGRGFDRRKVY
ncbi:MAG: YitT family protein [Deltaproteobacteria bacterium]|nr:YitT family protein [Deltaproteobacteria bacterium]